MPTFDQPEAVQSIKMLYLGEHGAGKTGSLVSLAAAGYELRILDLDKGVEVLRDFATNSDSPYRHDSSRPCPIANMKWEPVKGLWTEERARGLAQRLSFVPISETIASVKMPNNQLRQVPKGDLYAKITAQFDDWKDGEKSYGSILDWGPEVVLVIDSNSRFSDSIFDQQLAIAGRLIGKPEQSDYGTAQRELARNLKLLYSDAIRCHVIMICHIAYLESDAGPTRGYPQAIGKAIGPKMGEYFNHMLLAQSQGHGQNEKRVIKTHTSGMIELKTPAPLRVKAEYNLATGLAEYFAAVLGSGPMGAGASEGGKK